MPRFTKTRCDTCGIGYHGRRVGETCHDRSTGIRRVVKGEADVVLPCRGLLVTPEDYKRNHE